MARRIQAHILYLGTLRRVLLQSACLHAACKISPSPHQRTPQHEVFHLAISTSHDNAVIPFPQVGGQLISNLLNTTPLLCCPSGKVPVAMRPYEVHLEAYDAECAAIIRVLCVYAWSRDVISLNACQASPSGQAQCIHENFGSLEYSVAEYPIDYPINPTPPSLQPSQHSPTEPAQAQFTHAHNLLITMFSTRAFLRPSVSVIRSFSTSAARAMAKVTIIGRLGADPEMVTSSGGREYMKYTVASYHKSGGEEKISWFRVAAFEPYQKEYLLSLKKGCV